MKRIGRTEAGNHIVEMTPDEASSLSLLAHAINGKDPYATDYALTPGMTNGIDNWLTAIRAFCATLKAVSDAEACLADFRAALETPDGQERASD